MDEIKDLMNKADDYLRYAQMHLHRDREAFDQCIKLAETYNDLAKLVLQYETFKRHQHERT